MNKLKIGIITLALVIAGTAGATVLSNYVSVAGDVDVTPAVTWGDGTSTDRTYTLTNAIGGSTYTLSPGNIKNNANNEVNVEIVTTVVDTEGYNNGTPKDITTECAITHEVEGDGATPSTSINGLMLTTLLVSPNNLPFSTEITLPADREGVFTITTSVNPV